MPAIANVVVLGLIMGAVVLARAMARNRYWRENALQLWRRRPAALLVIAVYLAVGLLDSIAWVSAGEGAAAGDRPRTIIDRASAPRASTRRATRHRWRAPPSTAASRCGTPARICWVRIFSAAMSSTAR